MKKSLMKKSLMKKSFIVCAVYFPELTHRTIKSSDYSRCSFFFFKNGKGIMKALKTTIHNNLFLLKTTEQTIPKPSSFKVAQNE